MTSSSRPLAISSRPLLAMTLLASLAGGPVASGGCVPDEQRTPLALRRAATDLRCSRDQLSIRKVADRLYAVSGCGRSATYKVICKLTVRSCYLLSEPPEPVAAHSSSKKHPLSAYAR